MHQSIHQNTRMYIVVLLLIVTVEGFQPETYNFTEPITTVLISNNQVLVVTSGSIYEFNDFNKLEDSLLTEVRIPREHETGSDKAYFAELLDMDNESYLIRCTINACFIHPLSDVNIFSRVHANTVNFTLLATLGASISQEAVIYPCISKFCHIFSAQTTKAGVTYISERYFGYNNGTWGFYTSLGKYSYFKSFKNKNFDYLYSFRSNKHAYFLRNERQQNGQSQTYISQICKDDVYFRSYVENKLECHGYVHLLAATTIQINGDLFLMASFSDWPIVDDVTNNNASVVCVIRITSLEIEFSSSVTSCFKRGKGHWPAWIDGEGESCNKILPNTRYLCGYTAKNTRIASESVIDMKLLKPKFHDDYIVAMVFEQDRDTPLGFFGTKAGEVIKVMLDDYNNNLWKLLKLQVSNGPIKQVILSEDASYLFWRTANTLGKLPLTVCDIHNDCYSCMMSNTSCVWVTDVTTGRNGTCVHVLKIKMDITRQYENFCRPVVFDITPKSGPIEGGTTVTVSGQFDTPVWYGVLYGHTVPVTVWLGQGPCHVTNTKHFPNRFECVTEKQTKATNVTLRLGMNNSSRVYNSTYIRSTNKAVFRPKFSFMEAAVSQSVPPYRPIVPLSGGIQISIYGSNLDIGNQHSKRILVGNNTCEITDHDRILAGEITCKAPAQYEPAVYEISFIIDDNTMSGRSSVEYIPDPKIIDVQPKHLIASGGIIITISGEYLVALRQHVSLHVEFPEQDDQPTMINDCTYMDNDATLQCLSVPMQLNENGTLDGQANLYNIYGEMLSLNEMVYIVSDPVMEPDDRMIIVLNREVELFYNGAGLDTIRNIDVNIQVGDTTCHVTEMNDTRILCLINVSDESIGLREKVQGRIGNKEYDLGTIAFLSSDVDEELEPQLSREVGNESSTTVQIVSILKVVGGIVLGGMLCTVIAIAVKRKCQQSKRRRNEHLSVHFHQNERVLNLQGLTQNLSDSQQNRLNDYVVSGAQRGNVEDTNVKETSPLLLDEDTCAMFKRKHLLIPNELLVIGEVVGQGHFGCVYKGYLQQPEEKNERIVACKTLQSMLSGNKPREMDIKAFMKEALIMKDFSHRNVMELVGICLGIEKLPLVVLPFMRMGDVLTYIRNVENIPTVKDLVVFGVDIANGMYYLSQLKFIHRDLAARNCMIDEDMTVKVADFGLSRDIYEKEYYSSCDKKAQLPVKWMSPESLEFGLFTSKSDVWSFGVVLWELLTRGVNPYPTVNNWDILRFLKEERRLSKPDFCPEEMYGIMKSCWQWNPDNRPTFGDLTISIPDLLRRLERASERRKRLASERSLSDERERKESM
ncbi:hypothetical protein ACF0H5_013920 [Mactra antiquata]